MPSPDPMQYDSFAAEYEDHAAAAPYNTLYEKLSSEPAFIVFRLRKAMYDLNSS